MAPGALRLYYSNSDTATFSTEVTLKGVDNVVVAGSHDEYLGWQTNDKYAQAVAKVKKMQHIEMGNLPQTIMLAVGKPYMITPNSDVKDGLLNGVVGTLQVIEYAEDAIDAPCRLWFRFNVPNTKRFARIKAKPLREAAKRQGVRIDPDLVPIELRSVTITLDQKTRISCKNKQFPHMQASAPTVNKPQGVTYSDVVYDYGKKHPQKLVYVALSRCTDLNRLYITNINDDFTFYHRNENVNRDLQDEFRHLENHHLPIITKACNAMLEELHSIAHAAQCSIPRSALQGSDSRLHPQLGTSVVSFGDVVGRVLRIGRIHWNSVCEARGQPRGKHRNLRKEGSSCLA